jgi:hypothetical protein
VTALLALLLLAGPPAAPPGPAPPPGSAARTGPCARLAALLDADEPRPRQPAACADALQEGCRAGRPRACAELAAVLLAGEQLPADPARAEAALEEGCLQEDRDACFALAGRPAAAGRRGRLLEAACANGHAGACLAQGEEAPEGSPRARERLRRGCDLGAGAACLRLSRLPRSPGEPARLALLERGCALGDGRACTGAALLRAAGLEVRDPERAADLLERACALGDGEGCARLGLALLRGTGVPRDEARGRALLLARCEALGAEECLDAAEARLGGAAKVLQLDPGPVLLEALCRRGEPVACHRLGALHQEGVRVPADGARAAALYGAACDQGVARACADLAQLVRLGAGVPADPARARELMRRACQGGAEEGCRLLELDAGP